MAASVSLCATLFNEAESIDAWLRSVLAQSRKPDEIVLCDAGSTDGTIERIEAYAAREPAIRLHVEPGANVAAGRNAAIALAHGPLIAVTDAGTIVDENWLERLVAPLEADPETGVCAGFYRPAGRNFFERVLAAVITPRLQDIAADGFPPSSRSIAFRKEAWAQVGGYPEWMRAGEDLVFDFSLRDSGTRFAFASNAIVSWYPRPDLPSFFAQYRHYARGDGHGHLWTGRHAVRYAAYLAGMRLAFASRRSRLARLALAAGLGAHLHVFFDRVRTDRPFEDAGEAIAAYALVPVIVIAGDVAKMAGYPQGLAERHRAGGPEGLSDADFGSHRERPAPGATGRIPVS